MRKLLVLVIVNFLWATQFPASRIAAQELGGLTLTWFAMLLTMAILTLRVPVERRARVPAANTPGRRTISLDVIALGVAGSLVSQMCLNWGLEQSLASNAAVLNLSTPVLMAILASILLRERMSAIRWLAFGISLAGVVLVSDVDWRSVNLTGNQFLFGNLLLFASCAGSAFYNVYSKRVLEWMGPAELVVTSFGVSLVVLLPAMLYYEPDPLQRLLAASTPAVLSLVVVAVFSLALSMVLYFGVLQDIDATQASLSIYLLPVFGVIVSAATLRERLKPSLLIGGLLVATGAWLVTAYEERQRIL
jgi:drug/metabolite transporter (DMT)-like permease